MFGQFECHIFMLTQTLCSVASFFYHTPSSVVVKPSEILNDGADFGFSMAYQDGHNPNLVVGSPHGDLGGRVYSCLIDKDFNNKECKRLDIDVKKLAPDFDANDLKQHYCLGASIVATPTYFLTCAPLWTTTDVVHCTLAEPSNVCEYFSGSYGTCFVYYNQTSKHRFNGLLEQYKKSDGINRYSSMYGGIGWSLLADPSNEVILLGKPAAYGDVQYIDRTSPLSPSQSLYFNNETRKSATDYFKKNPSNIGYAFAAGKFFSTSNKTEYAFTMQNSHAEGKVSFLQYKDSTLYLHSKDERGLIKVEISSGKAGSMFGAALCSADMNVDGFSDLLVGAPAHSTDVHSYEAGALYIYLGGDLNIDSDDRKRIILGDQPGARFGAALAASDLDGDSIPEIFVSAPYADEGVGTLYILSGYEINRTIISFKSFYNEGIKLSTLKLTQKIQMQEFRSFGFSLEVVKDVNDNGCDELAVGSPRNTSVFLLRCVPAINATISTKLLNEVIKKSDMDFTVKVCIYMTYHSKPEKISTKLSVICEIKGNGVEIKKAKFEKDLSLRPKEHCEDIKVEFKNKDSGSYHFFAKVESNVDSLLKEKDFNPTWVRLSPYSKLESSFNVTRHCSDADCTPRLQLHILWAGSATPEDYYVDSNTKENVTLIVKNTGANVYDACVRVRITGAQVLSIACGVDDTGAYKCNLPRPLLTDAEHQFNILVRIGKAVNEDDKVHIEALLYNNCNLPNMNRTELNVNVIFVVKNVFVSGKPHTIKLTDTQIMDPVHTTLTDRHEYTIVNNGTVSWQEVTAKVTMVKKIFIKIHNTTINGRTCTEENTSKDKSDVVEFTCTGNLPANSSIRVITLTDVLKEKIMNNLENNELKVESKIRVFMILTRDADSKNHVSGRQNTTIIFVKELTIGNNKTLIIILAIVGALIIMALLVFVLYKLEFFERKEKERLDSVKASFRSKTSRPSTSGSYKQKAGSKGDDDNMDDIEIDVVDDCPFDLIPLTTDDAALIADYKHNSSTLPASNKTMPDAAVKAGEKQEPTSSKL